MNPVMVRSEMDLRPVSILMLTPLLFLYIYNISFKALPFLTTGRLAILVAAALVFVSSKRLGHAQALSHVWARRRPLLLVVVSALILHGIAAALFSSSSDNTQLSRSFHFGLWVIVGSIIFGALSHGFVTRFATAVSAAIAMQGLFIWGTVFSTKFRALISQIVVPSGHIDLLHGVRAGGISGGPGAALSVVQFAGVFTSLFLASIVDRKQRILALSVALWCAASTIPVGRTGLAASSCLIAGYLITQSGSRRHLLGVAVAAVALFACGLIGGVLEFPDVGERQSILERASETANIDTFQSVLSVVLVEQGIHPLDATTLLGTGQTTLGPYQSDSGYIHTYHAAGLVLAVIFYLAWLAVAFRASLSLPKMPRRLAILTTGIMMIIELKEPFIFKYALPFVLISTLSIASVSGNKFSRWPRMANRSTRSNLSGAVPGGQ